MHMYVVDHMWVEWGVGEGMGGVGGGGGDGWSGEWGGDGWSATGSSSVM